MPLRLIEIVVPNVRSHRIPEIVKEHEYLEMWEDEVSDEKTNIKILVRAENQQPIIDDLEATLGWKEGFRIITMPVESVLPQIEEKEEAEPKEEEEEEEKEDKKGEWKLKIGREELRQDLKEMADSSWTFVFLVILSSVVAAIGLSQNNAAVIIGSMVIAPLLGPNTALSLSTTLADFKLARKASKAILVSVILTAVLSIAMGLMVEVDPAVHEVSLRTQVGMGDVILALASGSAGVLSVTLGMATALVGVMVAVALLPPLVSFGLLLGSGSTEASIAALMLFFVNFICINLSGVITFLVQGVRPRTWWEADKAKKSTRLAIILWSIFLVILIIAIYISQVT